MCRFSTPVSVAGFDGCARRSDLSRSPFMRLSLASLDDANSNVARPAYDPAKLAIGVVHFGPGAFHRAHQAAVFDALAARDPRWGICGVSLHSAGVRDALAPQDGLYTLAILDENDQLRRHRRDPRGAGGAGRYGDRVYPAERARDRHRHLDGDGERLLPERRRRARFRPRRYRARLWPTPGAAFADRLPGRRTAAATRGRTDAVGADPVR